MSAAHFEPMSDLFCHFSQHDVAPVLLVDSKAIS